MLKNLPLCAAVVSAALASSIVSQAFPNFESPQVDPIAISADGTRMLVVNTPDHRVAVFSLANPFSPVLLDEIEVGLEPVSVAFRSAQEAWVVNHLSDSVSIVDLAAGIVIDTLQVDDEPSSITIAPNGRAFVTTSTRRLVQVFDVVTRAPVGDIPLFCDQPRWSTLSDDGSTLYVASHRSGNDTTVIKEDIAPQQPPPTNPMLPPAPSTGLIIASEDPAWAASHNVDLPDYDVFAIDTTTLTTNRQVQAVGTILFGLATHPTTGDVWVANTEARNLVRFEPNLRGHTVDHRVTRVPTNPAASLQYIDLHAGVDYSTLPNTSALAAAIAQPTDIAFRPDGTRAYVAGFGSDRIGVLDGTTGTVLSRIDIGDASSARTKRGPRAVLHHPTAPLLYVVNRLSNSLSLVSTTNELEIAEIPLVYDPTPTHLKEGRGFLYDTKLSGNGLGSCAVCHIDATVDGIGWDLGDRGGSIITVPNAIGAPIDMHPMKGPMVTQTLVGLRDHEPFHWRGDRVDFADFNGAFDSLLGGTQLQPADMAAFSTFIDSVEFGPNPNRNRDDSLPTTPAGLSAADGESLFVSQPFIAFLRCVDCHALDGGTNDTIFPGSILQEPQGFKVAQLRNIYKRTGRRDSGGGMRTSGFGNLHDGTDDDVFAFLGAPVFGGLAGNTTQKTRLTNFVEAFDTGIKPTVGFSRTMDSTNASDSQALADRAVLLAGAAAGHCDVVAHGAIDGAVVSMSWNVGSAAFLPSSVSQSNRTLADLDLLLGQGRAVLTFMGVPPGQGTRIGIDRDDDGTRDADEAAVPYGAATPGCSHQLRESSPARVGNAAYSVVTEGAQPGSAGVMFLGFGSSSFPFLGIDILIDPAVLLTVEGTADAHGQAAFSLPLSDDPGLAGVQIFVQTIFLDPCGSFGLAATGGLAVTVTG